MMRCAVVGAAVAALISLALGGIGAVPVLAQRSDVVKAPANDKAMAAAVDKARKSLPEFWKELEKPGPGVEKFSVKVEFAVDGRSTEHIWVGNVTRLADGKLVGLLANDPRGLPGRKGGDRVTFADDQISDWQFMRNGKIVGNETMRPLLARMPKAEAAKYRAMLEKP